MLICVGEGVTCFLGSADAGGNCACGVLLLSFFEAPGYEPPCPGVRRPLLGSAVCGKSDGRIDAGRGVVCCACAGEGAACFGNSDAWWPLWLLWMLHGIRGGNAVVR